MHGMKSSVSLSTSSYCFPAQSTALQLPTPKTAESSISVYIASVYVHVGLIGWAFWKCLLYIYFIRFACWMVSIYMHRLHPVGTACVRLDSLPCNVVMLLETILLKMQTLRLCVLIGGFSCCYSAVRHWFLTMNVVIIDKCGFFFIAPMVMNTSHKRCF